jgi:hypothetical protein
VCNFVLGSECINWFCKAGKPVTDEDGVKIDNPILLFDIFIRNGIRAIFKRSLLIENPEKDEKENKQPAKVKALVFEISGESFFAFHFISLLSRTF